MTERFSADALSEALGIPRRIEIVDDRERRVAMLGTFAQAVMAGELPSAESAMFIAGAIQAWLRQGGSLERAHLKVSARRGSHATPASIWARHRDERQDDCAVDSITTSDEEADDVRDSYDS